MYCAGYEPSIPAVTFITSLLPTTHSSPLQHDIDRLRVGHVFLLQNSRGQRVLVVGVQHRDRFLHDDGSVVEFFIHKMHGAAGDFYAVGEGLFLRFEAGECGQQRRMNIQNAPRKLLHEPGREQAHVSGQADQIDFVLLQRGDDFAIVLFARLALGRNDQRLRVPCGLAISMPPASGLLEMTTAMRALGILPAATLWAMASKFEPRPESRMPRFFMEELSASASAYQHISISSRASVDNPPCVVILSAAKDLCISRAMCRVTCMPSSAAELERDSSPDGRAPGYDLPQLIRSDIVFTAMYQDFHAVDRWTKNNVHCIYQALIVAIATRHADAVDIKFLVDGRTGLGGAAASRVGGIQEAHRQGDYRSRWRWRSPGTI